MLHFQWGSVFGICFGLVAGWIAANTGPAAYATANEPIEFNRDIRPILSDNCFFCHGFDEAKREAGLRLDVEEAATEHAIIPGKPDESELFRRLLSDDPDEIMPPPETQKRLTGDEIDLVRRWIEQGAKYQEHWAWSSLSPPAIDPQQEEDGANHPVDVFLRRTWQREGVDPVGRASPRERIRRLSFDLRGLPPTYADVKAFERDPSDASFLQFRDRWMKEIAYAEHQAVAWLDLVRWADTSGFVSDEPIASGAYRAWVIRAFADNLPFDDFSRWQLAGDLLPNPTDDQLIASGYNRIVNTNCEAGAIELEQLYKLKGEHVRALGTAWLGVTTGCAECHDHKFDPFSSRDYYSLAAFFDDLVEAGVYTPGDRREPLHYVFEKEEDSQNDRQLAGVIRALRKQIDACGRSGDQAFQDVEQALKDRLADQATRSEFVWAPAQLPAMRVLEGSFEMTQRDGRPARNSRAQPGEFQRHHAAELMTGYIVENQQKVDPEKDGYFVDVWIDPDDRPVMLAIQISHGDYGRLGWRTANYETYYWGTDESGTLKREQPWSEPKRVKRMGELPDASGWVRLKIHYSDFIKPVGGQAFEAVGMAWIHCGGNVAWGNSGMELRSDKAAALEVGETAIRKWWEEPFNRQTYESRMGLVAKALKIPDSARSPLQKELVHEAVTQRIDPTLLLELQTLESRLHRARSLKARPVLVSRQSETTKQTRVLARGDYQDTSGPLVMPAFPGFLATSSSADSSNEPSRKLTRLDLANFLFEDAGDLVARVFVNRLWHQFYGRGLSETLEDAGTQGDWPSHPELLDYLAMEFRKSNWNRNHIVRLLTSADAYQLSSVVSDEQRDRDPSNRLHARQMRYRLPAESVRDATLSAAGLLRETVEIPVDSFFPYQPDPYWSRSDKVMFGSRHLPWRTSLHASQYQRSVYTFWKRQNIHPTMMAFDAPTRQECTAKRNRTNTPGQALALLNDPIFVDAAIGFAARLIKEESESDPARIRRAFRIALQRQPSDQEAEILLDLLAQQRQQFGKNRALAEAFLQVGQSSGTADIDQAEFAAWAMVTRTLLNLHEFLNRP